MTDFFFDSSALVKRYIKEVGSAWVAATVDLATGNRIFIAEFAAVEITAAIARRTRVGYSPAVVNTLFANLQHDLDDEYFDLEVTSATLQEAQALARKHFLRGYDAVQIAVAIRFNREQLAAGLPAVTLVAGDTELLAAALAEDLAIDNPNDHS